jgi:hypothetical protein
MPVRLTATAAPDCMWAEPLGESDLWTCDVSVPDPSERRHEPRAKAGGPRRRPAATPAPNHEGVTTVRSALELVGLVVAPTTIITALAFFFGWTLTNSRASYFGIDASALGLSTQDYVLRSTDALFVPLGTVLVLALLVLSLHAVVSRALLDPAQRHALRVAARGSVAAGAVLFVVGVAAVFEPLSFSPHYLFPPASPGIGIALLAYGLHVLGRVRAAEPARTGVVTAALPLNRPLTLTLVWLLVLLSAFWTASEYADALGRGRAAQLVDDLDQRPRVAVFAPRRLQIVADGVTERLLGGRDSAYRYRYVGLRLLTRSGGKYFLLPEEWSRATGAAIVLPDSPSLRFEFGAGR